MKQMNCSLDFDPENRFSMNGHDTIFVNTVEDRSSWNLNTGIVLKGLLHAHPLSFTM
jgi:hypothetical protein